MKKYKLLNAISGWIVFAIAAVVYLLTIEPTASLWDCGEFIASAYKLEVGHPPGSPIFMMTANLFTQLTANPELKAAMVNSMSAIFSALTILFLFWTITFMVKKLVAGSKSGTVSISQAIIIISCGAVGALAYTFSDTFWFSAVEGEVYAFSSLMTAVVVWLILKWEDVADEPHADRWLILIAYLMGISIAVHLLNLLCIPAIVLVYYFKKNPNANLKGSLVALLVSFLIVAVLLFGIIQGVVKVAGWFELLCVNSFGLPYNSGVILYTVLVAGALICGILETLSGKSVLRVKIAFMLAVALLGIPFLGNSPWLGIIILIGLGVYLFSVKKFNPVAFNAILTGLLVITIGYSSYALIMIRSSANAPMDENSPKDIFTLRTYLSREQYGDTPLLYGQTYVSEPKYVVKGNSYEYARKDLGPVWTRVSKENQDEEKDRYFESMRKEKSIYRDELNMLFPRMYSMERAHVAAYKSWANIKGQRVVVTDPNGESKVVMKPTFIENIRFFLNYQVNFMYFRYFMWNFSGRQNDIQGHGEVSNGNWITGIRFIDHFLAGPQDNLPDFIVKNKGHNVYYMLPLILGLLGIAFQVSKGRKGIEGFWVTFLLFFMTGLAIVVYLNQTPYQPRERDYAYAGSFYAFCIWIGIGTAYIIRLIERHIKLKGVTGALVGSVLCLLVPLQMASQTWDDHDRSNRYTTRDFGRNYLATCERDAIIFTMGDNDTFPLWYAQEVEGYRTDVRVCNLSYLQTDWYIDQMKRQSYESDALPISWTRSEYINGKHDVGWLFPHTDEAWDVSRALNRVKSNDPRTKRIPNYSIEIDNIPTYALALPVDRRAAVASGTVKPAYANEIVDTMYIYLGEHKDAKGNVLAKAKNRLGKQEMMVLDILSNNRDWKRPVYYAITVSPDEHVRLSGYFRQDGVAYRVVPYRTDSEHLRYDTDTLYDNLMNKYRWGNLEREGLYVDENTCRLARTFRSLFGTLGQRLVADGRKEDAVKAMDYALRSIPDFNVPYDYQSTGEIAKTYLLAGDTAKAKQVYDTLTASTLGDLEWYSRLSVKHYASILRDVHESIYILSNLAGYYEKTDATRFAEIDQLLDRYYAQFKQFESRPSQRGARN